MAEVLLTGASAGIGASTARLLTEAGWRVIGIGRRPQPDDFTGVYHRCDLVDPEQTADVLRRIVDDHEVAAVVNNAGLVGRQPVEQLDLATLHSVLEINVRAAVQVVQAALPHLRRHSSGRIVNVASRAIHGAPERTAYSAAKSALVGCTRSWALEFARFGITSNAVAPGPTGTDLFRRGHPVGSSEERRAVSSVPLGRLAKPDEIGALIRFLLSDDAAFITGQVIGVDGGASLGGR